MCLYAVWVCDVLAFFLSRSINKVSELLIIYVPMNLPFYRGSECHLYSFNPAENKVVEIYCERWSWNRYSEVRTWVQQTIRPGSRNKADCWKEDGKSLMLYFMLYTLVAIFYHLAHPLHVWTQTPCSNLAIVACSNIPMVFFILRFWVIF